MELALAFVVLLVASAAHAVTSFGYVLISVPLLALIFDPHTAVVAAVMASALVTLVGWSRERAHVDRGAVRRLALSGVLGMPLGLLAFSRVDANLLLGIIGVVTIVVTLLIAARVRLPAGTGPQVAAGVVSGALLTTTGTNGPPLVIALQTQDLTPAVFRATLQSIFTLQGALAVLGLGLVGKITGLSLAVLAVSIPAAYLGWLVGDRVFHRLSADRLRQLVMAVLVVSGVTLVTSALT